MQTLPVPPLDQTVSGFLEYVEPLVSREELEQARQLVGEFVDGDGRACQEALERRAERADAEGLSWLADTWLDGYLTVREPLQLSSNVGFQVTWPTALSGLDRAADLAHRMAQVHLAHLRGELPEPRSPRGQALCTRQRVYLAGGIRHPQPERDEIRPGRLDPADREIVVVHDGRAHAVTVSDAAGQVLPLSRLRAALADIVAGAEAPTDTGESVPFTAWSPLGAEDAVAHRNEAFTDPHNVEVYDRLTHGLFVLALVDGAREDDEHLWRAAFAPDLMWVSKPITYLVGLHDDHVGLHIEHTVADGGILDAGIAAAQDLGDGSLDGPSEPAPTTPLTWQLGAAQRERLAAQIAEYRQAAEEFSIRIVRVPAVRASKISHDAVMQTLLIAAQARAFERIGSVYEAVDMREFQAGRTETMRPVSTESVALARALLRGDATTAMLQDSLAVHRERIIRCKTGQAVDRHLLGLRTEAAELGLTPELFSSPAYRRLVTDVVSTSSLGGNWQIARYAFAPTSAGGVGVGYNPISPEPGSAPTEYEFVITSTRTDPRIDDFVAGIEQATPAMADLVATLPAR